MQMKRALQSSACSRRCAIGAARRWSKPLVLATAIVATSLFHSCKKFDPRDYANRKPVAEDTAVFGKNTFKEIGPRKFAGDMPLADTLKADTAKSMVPLKEKPLVAAPGSE